MAGQIECRMGKRTLGLFPLPMRVVGDVVLRLLHCGFSDFFHGFATAIQLRFTFFAVATFRDVDFKFTFCAAIHIAIFGSFHDSFSFANVKIRRTSPLQGFPANHVCANAVPKYWDSDCFESQMEFCRDR